MQARALLGALIFGFTVVAHFCIAYARGIPITAGSIAIESLVLFIYLGWLGIVELRRLQKTQAARAIQISGIILLVPVLLRQLDNAQSLKILCLAAALMLSAFIMALWYRRADRASQVDTSGR